MHGLAQATQVQSCVLLSRDQDSAGGQSARGIPFVPSLPRGQMDPNMLCDALAGPIHFISM